MQAIILDTETHTLNGQPIEIAYAPIEITNGKLSLDKSQVFDQLYTVDEPISFAAMAVHHILESDLVGKPHYTTFKLPAETQYIIGHNIDYDIRAIENVVSILLILKRFVHSPLHVWSGLMLKRTIFRHSFI